PAEDPAHIPNGLRESMNDVDEVVRHELRARKTADAARPVQRCDREDDVQTERPMQPHRAESPEIYVRIAHPERVQAHDPWAILTAGMAKNPRVRRSVRLVRQPAIAPGVLGIRLVLTVERDVL